VTVGWEDRAAGWIAWARTPGHDGYWAYRDSFFELLPAPGGRALEIGCGEGRVCRDLRERGYDVVGLDASPTLVAAARELDPRGEYVVAAAEALPFADGSFDPVVAYNSLMDVDDLPAAVRDAARVLAPGGRFCACVLHPIADAGRWTSRDDDASFLIEQPYSAERDYALPIARDGLEFTFASRRYPLESYARALEDAGLLLEATREPRPAAGSRGEGRAARVPVFLHLRAVKP
jgi:SAM-dependent methyltransferase